MQVRQLTDIPPQVPIDLLHDNLKLYSEEDIKLIKSCLHTDGRSRFIATQNDKSYRLEHAVIHFGDKYVAVVDGKSAMYGEGAFSTVKIAQDLDSGEFYALKVMTAFDDDQEKLDDVYERELDALVQTKNVVESSNQPVAFKRDGEGSLNYKKCRRYYLMKLAKGGVVDSDSIVKLPLTFKIQMTLQLLDQMKVLAKLGLLHRDIKSDNVLYSMIDNKLSLIDYSFALKRDGKHEKLEAVGTLGFVDPVLFNKKSVTVNDYVFADLYSLYVTIGVIWELIDQSSLYVYWENARLIELGNGAGYKHNIKTDVHAFLQMGMSDDVTKRPTIENAMRFFADLQLKIKEKKLKVLILDAATVSNMTAIKLSRLSRKLSSYHVIRLFNQDGQLSEDKMLKVRHMVNNIASTEVDTKYLSGNNQALARYMKRKRRLHGHIEMYTSCSGNTLTAAPPTLFAKLVKYAKSTYDASDSQQVRLSK